jgi:hypothetical protein
MTRTHTIRVAQDLEALGIELASFVAEVTVTLIPEKSGDGWLEPHKPACAELKHVAQLAGPFIAPWQLTLWADAWVDDNQDFIFAGVRASEAF